MGEQYLRTLRSDVGGAVQMPIWGVLLTQAIGAGASAALSLNGAEAVRWFSDVDAYLKFGDNAVAASADLSDSYFLPAGIENIPVPLGTTHFSVIQASASGDCQLTRLG